MSYFGPSQIEFSPSIPPPTTTKNKISLNKDLLEEELKISEVPESETLNIKNHAFMRSNRIIQIIETVGLGYPVERKKDNLIIGSPVDLSFFVCG